jgi:hypothetical protein
MPKPGTPQKSHVSFSGISLMDTCGIERVFCESNM